LPEQPGVYLWGNRDGETIYVGKARSLRDRVRSYLGAAGMSPRHDALLDEITSVDVIVTDSVMEALALENNLIKQRSPKYNILLRDDKNYPYLQLTTASRFRACSSPVASNATATSMPGRFFRQRSRAGRWGWRTGCSASARATR
jgi:excinuclease UvrABC nuclease subunit